MTTTPEATGSIRQDYYRVKDWNDHFENNRTRDMKSMAWVPVPNKHDGEGFQRIMQEKDGMIIYGCWHLILQVASKCLRNRGTLLRDDGTPLNADSIALKTGWMKPKDFERAIAFLSSPQVAWLERLTQDGKAIPQVPAEIPHPPARKGTEGKGIEGKGNISEAAKRLSIFLLDEVSKATGRKMISKPQSGHKPIQAILDAGEPAEDVQATIVWLTTHNLKRDYPYVVQSAKSLKEKWDNIRAAMLATKPQQSSLDRASGGQLFVGPKPEGVE